MAVPGRAGYFVPGLHCPGGSHAAQKLGGCCVGVCCGLSSAVLFQRGSGGHPIHHLRQRHGGYPPGTAVWRNPVPVCRGGRAQNRLFCLCHATCRADHDQRYRFCLCLDRYVPDRAGSAVRYAAPGYKAWPHFRRIAGKMQYSGGGGAGGVYQLEPLYRRRDPNRNHWGQRGQRGPELWCCADRRHQAAAGHWARRTLCPDHAEHGPGIFVPPRLFGGRAHHGRQLHSAAVHGGLCGSACRCRTPPHRGWLCGRGVLLCRAVSLPPDFVLLQFFRGRRLRLEGL